jgi:hypothetical protein
VHWGGGGEDKGEIIPHSLNRGISPFSLQGNVFDAFSGILKAELSVFPKETYQAVWMV